MEETALRLAVIWLGAALAAGCSAPALLWPGPLPPAPGRPTPRASLPDVPTVLPQRLPASPVTEDGELSLIDVIELALANNPQTRAAWNAARAAAAQVGIARGAYYPEANLSADIHYQHVTAIGGLFRFTLGLITLQGSARWLLFDLRREATVEQARAALLVAAWQNDAVLQNVVLQVQQIFYQYLNAKAQLVATEANLRQARADLAAVQQRQLLGLASLADSLQAETALAQVELSRQQLEGQALALRGQLAAVMGLAADTELEVGTLPADVGSFELEEEVGRLIAEALACRPDLAAARWQAQGAKAAVSLARAQFYPTLTLDAFYNRVFFVPPIFGVVSGENAAIGAVLNIPLFNGFARSFGLAQAEAQAEQALEQVRSLEQQVALDVWTNHTNVRTAQAQVATSRALLRSAEAAARVSFARYQQGLGGIQDLLPAQAALASARVQEVQARAAWLLAVVQLAHALGALLPGGEQPSGTTRAGHAG